MGVTHNPDSDLREGLGVLTLTQLMSLQACGQRVTLTPMACSSFTPGLPRGSEGPGPGLRGWARGARSLPAGTPPGPLLGAVEHLAGAQGIPHPGERRVE